MGGENNALNYFKGCGVEQDYKKVFELALKSAENGMIWAMDLLGDFYYYGLGVEKDCQKASYWYRKANDSKSLLAENYKALIQSQEKNGNYEVKIKCKNCGQFFTVRERYLLEHPYDETKEDWNDATFLRDVNGVKGFCPECRKYEIMTAYIKNWLDDYIGVERMLEGFTKVGKIKDWKIWLNQLPKSKGVYAVIRESEESPHFLKVGTGGFVDGEDPNVGIEVLSKKWCDSSNKVMYIGRANFDCDNPRAKTAKSTIHGRVRLYMRFGAGKKSPHQGGKFIWQLADAGEFDVWYKVSDYPQRDEYELIEKYKPFANRKSGDNR